MAPTGGRSMAATADGVVVEMPQMSAVAGRRSAVAAFVGCGPGLGPLVRTRIAAPSKVTSTVPSRSVRYVRPA
jgi:hypothetical protein